MFTLEHFSHTSIYKLTIESRVRDEEHSGGTIRVSSLVSGLGKCVPTAVNKYLTDRRLHCSQGTCIYFNIQVGCSVEAL